jgi:hypothetical protein
MKGKDISRHHLDICFDDLRETAVREMGLFFTKK